MLVTAGRHFKPLLLLPLPAVLLLEHVKMHIVGISAALNWRERFWDGLLNTGQQFLLVGGDTLHTALGQEH